MGIPNPGDAARSNRIIGIVLSAILAVSMLPVASIQSAFADEPAARPATTGGDVTLEGAAETVPAAAQREDGTIAADGLVYAATDGGLTFIGFDELPEGEDAAKEIVVPEAVSVDGTETPVVAVDIAEGQTADNIVSLTLPRSINNVSTATLAQTFPRLTAIEIAMPKASAPVAAGAAAIRATYSSFGGVLYRNAWVAADGDASQTTLTKELAWAPPATVVARIPAECTSIAPGAFADVRDLKTVVCFGVMEDIPQAQKAEDGTVTPGAFTDEQIQTANVIVPQTGTVVPNGEHVSASVAVTDDSTMDIKREAWWKSGFASDRITLGEVYGSTTNTLPVTEEGVLEVAEVEVAYAPETTQNSSSRKAGIEPPESAIPTPVPDDDDVDPSESGLVFTHLADMTLSVSWKGDPTATPSHLDIPAYATINGVTYPVTEIAPNAFKGAVFLTSITIPEGVKTIGESAFEDCANLVEISGPSVLGTVDASVFGKASASASSFGSEETARGGPAVKNAAGLLGDDARLDEGGQSFDAGEPSASQDGVPVSENPKNLDEDSSIAPYKVNGNTLILSILHRADFNDAFVSSSISAGWTPLGGRDTGTGFYNRPYRLTQDCDGVRLPVECLGIGTNEMTLRLITCSATGQNIGITTFKAVLKEGYVFIGCDTAWSSTGASFIDGPVIVEPSNTNGLVIACTPQIVHKSAFDAGYMTEADTEPNGRLDTWLTEKNYLTKAATDLDNFYGKAAFNTISYAGLEDASWTGALPTFYVDDAAKRPTVPEPRRDGYGFKGWTWGGQASPVKNPSAAFSGGGAVTLTAHWEEAEPETPEATHFFTGERPLRYDDASERQTHVIKVRLSNVQKTLASVSFEGDDRTRLLKDTSGVELYVASEEDALASGTRLAWGGSTGSGWTCALAKFADDSYGVYVGISVPTSAIDEASVPVSYTDGSYVASLVKMNYVFA